MRHLGRIALAYMLACIATAVGVKLDIELKRFLDPVVVQNTWHKSPPLDGWAMLAPITVVTVVPAAIAILLTEWKRVRKWTYYVAIGTLMGGGLGSIFTDMVITGVLLGALAGWIYWRIAGRHAGSWKRVES